MKLFGFLFLFCIPNSYATVSVHDLQNQLPDEYKLLGPELFDAIAKMLEVATSRADSASICNGRLTLSSGTAVTTSDVTNAATVYFTPFQGNRISLYTGSAWALYNFSEISVAVPSTTDTNFDIFIYNNSGTLTLEAVNWSGATTRATALALQDGVLVKSGATSRRYLGTGRTYDVSGRAADSSARRFLWNMYNRQPRVLLANQTTGSWTYNGVLRAANSNTTPGLGTVAFVVGQDQMLNVEYRSLCDGSASSNGYLGIGMDNTSDIATSRHQPSGASQRSYLFAGYFGAASAGYHYFQALEATTGGAVNVTFYGTGAGGPFSTITGNIQN